MTWTDGLGQDLRETAERRVETAIGSREPTRLVLGVVEIFSMLMSM